MINNFKHLLFVIIVIRKYVLLSVNYGYFVLLFVGTLVLIKVYVYIIGMVL